LYTHFYFFILCYAGLYIARLARLLSQQSSNKAAVAAAKRTPADEQFLGTHVKHFSISLKYHVHDTNDALASMRGSGTSINVAVIDHGYYSLLPTFTAAA
jgi:hypothetical protein